MSLISSFVSFILLVVQIHLADTLAFAKPDTPSSELVVLVENTPAHTLLYTLEADDPSATFEVLSQTPTTPRPKFRLFRPNVILLYDAVDYETDPVRYLVEIEAHDGVSSATCTIEFKFSDVNEGPELSGTFTGTVTENALFLTPVSGVSLVATDPEGDPVTYHTSNIEFMIDANTGQLKIATPLDYEYKDTYYVRVFAMDDSFLSGSTSTVTVSVIDVNDNPPSFSPSTYTTTVTENTASGQNLVQVTVTDPDTVGTITLAIVGGDDSPAKFVLSSNTLQTTSSPINYEALGGSGYKYTLTLTVDDSIATATATVTVTVTGVNEFIPIWSTFVPAYVSSIIPYSIDENVSSGTSILTISASDSDHGTDGQITYTVSDPVTADNGDSVTGLFQIHANTGVLSTLGVTVDRDLATGGYGYFEVTVTASDQGSPALFVTRVVRISLNDLNDNAPVCSQTTYSTSVNENVALSTSVLNIAATDDDVTTANNVVSYSVTGGDGAAHFTINTITGVLSTSASLDYEGATSYEVEICARDSGSPALSTTCTVQISLVDLNDNTPTFTSGSLTVSVSEASSVGATVTTVLATDSDSSSNNNNPVVYSFTSPSALFNIGSANGAITLSASLDRELVSSHTLIIHGEDQGSPTNTGSVTLTVSVTDANDNTPVFTSTPYSFNVIESEVVSTSVGQVQATDADIGSNSAITFVIQSAISGTSAHFNLDPSTGVITTLNSLDRESNDMYKFVITATDGGSPSLVATSTLTISINDVNDNAPVFTLTPYSFYALETLGVTTSVGQVQASDEDLGTNSSITFAISSVINGNGAHFNLNPTSGIITIANSLDRESIDLYRFEITATDGGSPSLVTTSTLTINVNDVNDNSPVFTSTPYSFNALETVAITTSIGQVQATDADIGSNSVISFIIVSVISGNIAHFNLDPSTGTITNTISLDRENIALYEFEITATDNGSPALTATFTFTIHIDDVNDNAPSFNLASYSVSTTENQPVGTSLLTVTINDGDFGSNGMYTLNIDITSPAGVLANSFIKINTSTGQLSVTQVIDRESDPSFNFYLVAIDQGVPALTSSVSVSVTVVDVNDNSPSFTSSVYTFNVSEASAISSVVGQLQATDTDAGLNAQIIYTINMFLVGTSSHLFLNNSTGVITTLANLDREVSDLYQFIIVATDGGTGSNTDTCTVTVHIDDFNDNTPVFDAVNYNINSAENSVVGTSILTVTVTDSDIGVNADVLLSINTASTEGTRAHLFVHVNSTSMTLSVKQTIDREIDSFFNFTLVATDLGTPELNSSANIFISIDDLNDNNPIFSQSDYVFNVTEATPVGNLCGTVIATDADIDVNANITYIIEVFLAGDNYSFIIEPSTGILTTASNLDRETNDLYVMTVVAADGGLPSLNNTATVTISLIDDNDNVPLFSFPLYESFILENTMIGTSVLSINVTDGDVGINADLILNIDTNTPEGARADLYIAVNSTSLILSVKQAIDIETDPNFVFSLIATDQGTPSLTSTTVINITVNDTNDNKPIFSPSFYSTEIAYNDHCRRTITTVAATDADSGINSKVTFSASRPYNTSLYALNGNTGDLNYVNSSDVDSKYLIYVTASDGGSPQLNSTSEAIVRIDTYDPDDVILKYHLEIDCVNYTTNEQTFLSQLTDVYNASYPTSYARRWCVDNSSSSSPCIVYVYVVANDTADEVTELNNTKYFLHADDALSVTSQDSGGTPAAVITGPLWASFGITKVEKYSQPVTTTDDDSSTPWVRTPAGIAALTLLSGLGLAGIGAIIAQLIHSYVNQPPLNKKVRKLNRELRKQRRRERRLERKNRRRAKKAKKAASQNGPENQRFDNSMTRVSINEGFTETDGPHRVMETEPAETNIVSGSQVRILEVEPISNV